MSFEDLMGVIIWDYMWGMPMVVVILAAGFYLTCRTGFFQLTGFAHVMRSAWANITGKSTDNASETGVLSSIEATSMALGTTIGVGNIGGVATAIATGGPGAVFWMWLAGLFGMIIKMAEVTLAVYYRSKDENNEAYGGPNYYMKKGLYLEKHMHGVFKTLSFLFSFGFLTGFFINIQTYTVSEAVANTFDMNMMTVGVVYTVVLYLMIWGGIKGLGKIAVFLVPVMCIFYLIGGLYIIFSNISALPGALALIVKSAFTGNAALGGFMGAAVTQAIKVGLARSVFSNEAGWGSAPMIHAAAKVDHPVKQGLMGVFEVFMDTFVICSITCLLIIVTRQWSSGLDGATLTLASFESGMGRAGRVVLATGVFIFGLTTYSGIYAQMEVIVRYLIGNTPQKKAILSFYKWTYPIPSLALVWIAVYFQYPGTTVWLFSDASTALPIFANVVTLMLLAPKFIELLNDYKARYLGVGTISPDFKVFFEDNDNA
ncbi:MAG: amino acid carrier protein [Synergistaceae bacterium]|nr:amino acid carrier protein [Synergistaceae bacterium]